MIAQCQRAGGRQLTSRHWYLDAVRIDRRDSGLEFIFTRKAFVVQSPCSTFSQALSCSTSLFNKILPRCLFPGHGSVTPLDFARPRSLLGDFATTLDASSIPRRLSLAKGWVNTKLVPVDYSLSLYRPKIAARPLPPRRHRRTGLFTARAATEAQGNPGNAPPRAESYFLCRRVCSPRSQVAGQREGSRILRKRKL